MTTDRKKPGVAFWATVVVVVALVLLAYPLSFGPACRIFGPVHAIDDEFCTFFRPLLIALQHCPQPVRNGARWYFELWLPPDLKFLGEPHGGWFFSRSK
jgi:hypothetical protein